MAAKNIIMNIISNIKGLNYLSKLGCFTVK